MADNQQVMVAASGQSTSGSRILNDSSQSGESRQARFRSNLSLRNSPLRATVCALLFLIGSLLFGLIESLLSRLESLHLSFSKFSEEISPKESLPPLVARFHRNRANRRASFCQ